MGPCWVDKGCARIPRETCPTVGEIRLERGNRFAVRDRSVRRCGTEERVARRAAIRLGSHTLRCPRLPKHRRQGGGWGFDLRRPGGYRYRGHRLYLGTIATVLLSTATSLHLPANQDLHGSTVQPLPGCAPYPCPRLPEVGRLSSPS